MARYKVLISVPTQTHLASVSMMGVAKFACGNPEWDCRFVLGREDDLSIIELKNKLGVKPKFYRKGLKNG